MLCTKLPVSSALQLSHPIVDPCRLAMLGFIAAVGAELATGRKVSQQVAIAPGPIAGVFLLFTVASLIPILKVRHTFAALLVLYSPRCTVQLLLCWFCSSYAHQQSLRLYACDRCRLWLCVDGKCPLDDTRLLCLQPVCS